MNIIDVIFLNLLNQIENNIVHIPLKLPFLTFHQVSYQDLTKYLCGFNNYLVSLSIFLQIVLKNNFCFKFLTI
jgi:hypothetical protein